MVAKLKDSKVLAKIGYKTKDAVGAGLMFRNGNFILETDYGKSTGDLDKAGMTQLLRNCGVINPDGFIDQAERYDARAIRVQLNNVPIEYFGDSKTKDNYLKPGDTVRFIKPADWAGKKGKFVKEWYSNKEGRLMAVIEYGNGYDASFPFDYIVKDSKIKVKDSIKSRFNFKKTKDEAIRPEIKKKLEYIFYNTPYSKNYQDWYGRFMPKAKSTGATAEEIQEFLSDGSLNLDSVKDAEFPGKDQYKIKIYRSGGGYNWEVFDPEGRKSASGLQSASIENAKRDADRKLGMQIFSTLDTKNL